MNIYEKLLNIQMELKTPKSQWNDFGKYYFRSCEDILEAVKPFCKKNNTILYLNDMVENKGERYYLKAEAVLVDIEKPEDKIVATAEARECLTKKGMDESQITGTASSYARKYALDGLFGIDDTKDADSNEYNKADKDIKKKETPADESNKVTNNKEQNKEV